MFSVFLILPGNDDDGLSRPALENVGREFRKQRLVTDEVEKRGRFGCWKGSRAESVAESCSPCVELCGCFLKTWGADGGGLRRVPVCPQVMHLAAHLTRALPNKRS